MSVRSLLRVFLTVLWLWPAAALAQVEQWQSHMVAGVRAYQQGNYAEAERQWGSALKEAKRFGPQDPRLATTLNNLAALYQVQGNYAEAEPLYKRSLAIREKALGPEHPHVAPTLSNLGNVYKSLGRYTEAEPLYKRALTIRESALGPEHPDVAQSLESYAALLHKTGRTTEATKMEAHAKAIRAKHARENPAK